MGTPEDVVLICQAIHIHPQLPKSNVREIRWLSPNVVMARAGHSTAEYYYVLTRRTKAWRVLTYYMLWIS
jgi:hypothetical protein